jgi:hypothetical protein
MMAAAQATARAVAFLRVVVRKLRHEIFVGPARAAEEGTE